MKKVVLLVFLAFVCCVPSTFGAVPAKNFVIIDATSNESFVPIRFLNGFNGISVTWTSADQHIDIIKEQVHLTLFVGKTAATLNDEPTQLTTAPFIDNGVTYVPLKFVSEALDMQLIWDKDSASVKINQGEVSVSLPFINQGKNTNNSKPIVSEKKTFKVGKKSFSVQMVTISLLHPKIDLDVVLASDTIGKVEDLSSMAKRNNAAVAINGTFFDAYTTGEFKSPYGYIFSGNELLHYGDRRTVFTYDKNNLVQLIPGDEFQDRFKQGTIEGGLQAGPRLITNGKVSLDVEKEGFKDPKILTGAGARSALGITRDHKLILITTSGATIPQLAEIMKQAGAYQAMNLDGGASSGLYYNGKYITAPGRKISNAIIIRNQ